MSILGGSGARIQVFQHQALVTLTQANPVSGTIYTALAATNNVRLIATCANCTWTVQPTPLEIHLTVDGVAKTAQKVNPVTITDYSYLLDPRNETGYSLQAFSVINMPAFIIEGRSVTVQTEITGGTVSQLVAYVLYGKVP